MQPGATAKFGRQTAASRLGPAAEIRAIAPLGRAGVPEDLGLITALLASYEARWLDNVERTRGVSAFGSSLRRRRRRPASRAGWTSLSSPGLCRLSGLP